MIFARLSVQSPPEWAGLSSRGGEIKDGLKQAVAGLDDAVGSAAQTASYTLQEAVAQGKAFKDTELKASLEQLRDLETQIVDPEADRQPVRRQAQG
jgi:hypothetical protein